MPYIQLTVHHASTVSSPHPTMPRDLVAESQEEAISESPDAQTPKAGTTTGSNASNEFTIHRIDTGQTTPPLSSRPEKLERRDKLHPYVQTLSIADLDSCERLESSCFPEEERCTREKVRISTSTQRTVLEATNSGLYAFGGRQSCGRCLSICLCSPALLNIVYAFTAPARKVSV